MTPQQFDTRTAFVLCVIAGFVLGASAVVALYETAPSPPGPVSGIQAVPHQDAVPTPERARPMPTLEDGDIIRVTTTPTKPSSILLRVGDRSERDGRIWPTAEGYQDRPDVLEVIKKDGTHWVRTP